MIDCSAKYFIVSDVHSYYTELINSLNDKGFNYDRDFLVVNGDLFDRGKESKELLTFVKSVGDRFIYVRGNHEDLLEDLYHDIINEKPIGNHHYSNGTVKTIMDLCDLGDSEITYYGYTHKAKECVKNVIGDLLEWINHKCVNYFELGDYIITHSWIPVMVDDTTIRLNSKKTYCGVYDKWNINHNSLNDSEYMLYRNMWKSARWENPFECWKQGMCVDGKVIVSGHWHTSYGYSHIDMTHKEWPDKNRHNWKDSFNIWCRDNFIAIDGCVAYSGKINCIVIEKDSCGNISKFH